MARTVVGRGVVTFVDETTAGERRTAWGLEIAEERLTVRELIRRRVFQEVAEYNARTPRRIEPETQTALAERAFAGNGFLVLVGDRQVIDPDEEIELTLGTEVLQDVQSPVGTRPEPTP
ncbi:hypothetical protein ACFZCT_11625 [Streptomyces qaidamensis]|uniref:hypothetical protein n=1 Tax=Streptomyces qaidamensis TaxID=1783515 RepID=UPI0036E880AC